MPLKPKWKHAGGLFTRRPCNDCIDDIVSGLANALSQFFLSVDKGRKTLHLLAYGLGLATLGKGYVRNSLLLFSWKLKTNVEEQKEESLVS